MKIITVKKPIFEWNDKAYIVETQRLTQKNPFSYIQKEINRRGKEGMTHCFIYNISSVPENRDSDWVDAEVAGLFIRWIFAKVDNSEPKLGKNLKKIEKILRDEI